MPKKHTNSEGIATIEAPSTDFPAVKEGPIGLSEAAAGLFSPLVSTVAADAPAQDTTSPLTFTPQDVYDIVDKGLLGKGLDKHETTILYSVHARSKEAAYLRWAAQELSLSIKGIKAEVHAQIGLNGTICPKNCKFCSFAASNNARKGKYELPKDDVVEYAQIYEEDGANLILLLTTASYRFDKLEEMVAAVRAVISAELPLLVNTDDLTLDQWKRLKAAGANGAYHAVRMREGIDTGISLETRLATFDNLKEAGLSLSTCVEPVGPEHTAQELTEATFRCIESGAVSAGVGKRISVPGTQMFERGMLSDLVAANMVAVYRLAAGTDLRLNCSANSTLVAASGANLAWAEVGSNPRDTVKRTEHGGRGQNIRKAAEIFMSSGWEVLKGPSKGWILG
ncbi:MAG: radical SAM protein [Coriobacteriales bacterium]|nr:radical SAM protein [Coriobacteriales bacterium]